MKTRRARVLLLSLLLISACAKAPPSLTPAGARIWQANEATVALGEFQHTVIALNGVQMCEPAPCHPLVSDANTRIVVLSVTSALKTISAVPAGWRITANTALDQISQQLDATGKSKLKPYVEAARLVLAAIPGGQ